MLPLASHRLVISNFVIIIKKVSKRAESKYITKINCVRKSPKQGQ